MKLRSTFKAVLLHEVPTKKVDPAAGNNSVTKTPPPPGLAATAPQESEGAVAAAANAAGTFPEAKKLTNFLGKFYFD